METQELKTKSEMLLRQMLGEKALFREDQFEAIEAVMTKRGKLLIVQKTGWGKSVVYFIITKLLREAGNGPTLIISPLLSLMRNQILNAGKIGLKAVTVNSSNTAEWKSIKEGLQKNNYDLILISPERLSNDNFMTHTVPAIGKIGAFVVDEVHCISDWGHDFRPDYRRIKNIINSVFAGVPIIGTTATANNRVVKDLEELFGEGITTMRGNLARSGLKLQNLVLPSVADRFAWLADVIPQIPGTGVVYCLTRGDVFRVTQWLRECGIECHHYWGGTIPDEQKQDMSAELEQKLLDNKLKVMVATSALGMGYDKPDLNFVIHYQAPGSAVAYYQQVGRAGRAVKESYGVLLHGSEEDEILDYFMKEAFPTYEEEERILEFLDKVVSASEGEIRKALNLRSTRIEKALKHLYIDGYVSKSKSTYSRSVKKWIFDEKRREKVTECRIEERSKMKEYINHKGCLMKFITQELDDDFAVECGICYNCTGKLLPTKPNPETVMKALQFLKQDYVIIDPRKRWTKEIQVSLNKDNKPTSIIPKEHTIEQGRALCFTEKAGWGETVMHCIKTNTLVPEDVINAVYYLIRESWCPEPFPLWITYIPSQSRNTVIADFARRMAIKLKIPLIECIKQVKQKQHMHYYNNSQQKIENCIDAWAITNLKFKKPVLLIDDFVNSRWTLTVIGRLLLMEGVEAVYPLTLAATKENK